MELARGLGRRRGGAWWLVLGGSGLAACGAQAVQPIRRIVSLNGGAALFRRNGSVDVHFSPGSCVYPSGDATGAGQAGNLRRDLVNVQDGSGMTFGLRSDGRVVMWETAATLQYLGAVMLGAPRARPSWFAVCEATVPGLANVIQISAGSAACGRRRRSFVGCARLAGDGGLLARYDGQCWTLDEPADRSDLRAVWGRSGGDLFTAGETTALHFDGQHWTNLWGGAALRVNAIVGLDNERVLFGGEGIRRSYKPLGLWYGKSFAQIPLSSPSAVMAIWASPTGHAFVAGRPGALLRYDGVTWTLVVLPEAAAGGSPSGGWSVAAC